MSRQGSFRSTSSNNKNAGNYGSESDCVYFTGIFHDCDMDGSGLIDQGEFLGVLPKIGVKSRRCDLEKIYSEFVPGEEGMHLPAFTACLQGSRLRKWFPKNDYLQLLALFRRFDADNEGFMLASKLVPAAVWLHTWVPEVKMQQLVADFDVGENGKISQQQFLDFIRACREAEVGTVRGWLERHEALYGAGVAALTTSALAGLFIILGAAPNPSALEEIMNAVNLPSTVTLDDVWDVVQLYRQREGLTLNEVEAVCETFKQYDTADEREISVAYLGEVARRLGFPVAPDEVLSFLGVLGMGVSSKACLSDLTKLVRLAVEDEFVELRHSFDAAVAQLGREWLTIAEAQQVLREKGVVGHAGIVPPFSDGELVNGENLNQVGFTLAGSRIRERMRESFRARCFVSSDQAKMFEEMFAQYDVANKGYLSTRQLGALFTSLFPSIDASIKGPLEELMTDVEVNCDGRLRFDRFLSVMHMVQDLQTCERLKIGRHLMQAARFEPGEVQDMQELFVACADYDRGISIDEVIRLLEAICDFPKAEWHLLEQTFDDVVGKQEMGAKTPRLIFPEFLFLMRYLVNMNFANIQCFGVRPRNAEVEVDGGGTGAPPESELPRPSLYSCLWPAYLKA